MTVVLAVALLTAAPERLCGQSASVPITVVSTKWNPVDHTIEYTLRNDSQKTITAWHVRVTYDDQPVGAPSGHGVDAYRSAEGVLGSTVPKMHIPSGTTVTATIRLSEEAASRGFVQATITPESAIFNDLSFVGDARDAAFTFERRAKERDSWRAVVALFERARADEGPSIEGLKAAYAGMDGLVTEPHIKQLVRTNLKLRIDGAESGMEDAARGFDYWMLDNARRELAAATRHTP